MENLDRWESAQRQITSVELVLRIGRNGPKGEDRKTGQACTERTIRKERGMKFDSMILIPVTRATLYDPEDGAWEAADCGIHTLDLNHLAVDNQVNEGQVTLATVWFA